MADSRDPLWAILDRQGRTLVWLAQETEFSESQVRKFRAGDARPSKAFRARCERVLQIQEKYLFGDAATVETAVLVGSDAAGG